MRQASVTRCLARREIPRLKVRVRLCASALVLLAVLLAACSSTAKVPPRPTATATASPTSSPTPSVTAVPGPPPATQTLGAPPATCPSSPQPQTMSFSNGFGSYGRGVRFFGSAIVWIPEPSFPTVAHLEPHGYTEWPSLAITWEVGPDATDAVSVRVTNTQTGAVLWWVHGTPPDLSSQTLVLDAEVPGPAVYSGAPKTGWQQYQSSLLIPQAGCYTLDATWAGGSWQAVFAAGA